jgi:hypothetical protein
MPTPKNALAPLNNDEPAPATEPAAVVPVQAALDASETKVQMNRYRRTEAALKAQPKVPVRVPEDTTVQINTYGFFIKAKTTVMVPQQVYDILVEAGRI